jgi:hypothetical protein
MQKLLKQKRQKKNPKISASGSFLEKYSADASPAGSKAANEWSQ